MTHQNETNPRGAGEQARATPELPTYAISHGGGPWPWIKDLMPGDLSVLERALESIATENYGRVEAVLVVTAHWEEREFTVSTHPNPPMLYDYGGFPEFTYHLSYPAPGSPHVAGRVSELLTAAGIPVRSDADRGFDHGTFVPLYVMYPDATIPVVQMSIKRGFDPSEHLALGRALRPLRREGVLIIGSGLPTFHDLSRLGPMAAAPSREFDGWLTRTVAQSGPARSDTLRNWATAPSARSCHPREDHFIPLLVAAGAAETEPGVLHYHERTFMGSTTSSGYRFGGN